MNDLLKAKWERGKNNTLHFYRKKLPWKARQFNRELPLLAYFGPLIGDKKEVAIAELGAGMFCTIGSSWNAVRVKVYPSDALATEFKQILKEANISPLIPVTREDMENLSYPNNFFDIVHCVNALDHTVSPLKAVAEMYRICKPGGFIYLRHFVNVGESEKYSGLHMWNIDLDAQGDCVVWNPDKKLLLSDYFTEFKSAKKKELDYETEDMVVSILQKR